MNNPFVTRYQGGFVNFHLNKVERRIVKDGKIKNGYTLIFGLIVGFILGVSL